MLFSSLSSRKRTRSTAYLFAVLFAVCLHLRLGCFDLDVLTRLARTRSNSCSHSISQPLPYARGVKKINPGFAGYFPIRQWEVADEGKSPKEGKAKIFYWLIPAQGEKCGHTTRDTLETQTCKPLILWLQGGPGASSMIGLFQEMGPFRIMEDDRLNLNPYSWTTEYPMLFVDQPVGTGFSFVDPQAVTNSTDKLHVAYVTDGQEHAEGRGEASQAKRDDPDYSTDGYVRTQGGVGRDMMIFLNQFYARYTGLRQCGIYVTGESYGGKYVPTVATHILRHNEALRTPGGQRADKTHPEFIDLKGIAIGNGLTDPLTQINSHAKYALQNGFISEQQAVVLSSYAEQVQTAIMKNDSLTALDNRLQLFDKLAEFSGGINMYDVRKKDVPNNWSRMRNWLNKPEIQKALNVLDDVVHTDEDGKERKLFFDDPAVILNLKEDIMISAAPMFPFILESGVKVMLYQGQFDLRDGISGNTAWLRALPWSGQTGFNNAERKIWRMKRNDDLQKAELAGYYTKYGNLMRVEVLGAGHLAPADGNAPEATFDMIRRFTEDDWD